MLLTGPALAHLADYRREILYHQSPLEAWRMRALASELRQTLQAAGLSRQRFAEQTGLADELIVAIENGYGRPQTARRMLKLARAGLKKP